MLFNNIDKYLKNIKGAIHVGAHDGGERFWYIGSKFPRVIYFEPNPELYLRLQNNIENIKDHMAFNVGVHDTLKTATLHIASNDGQSSSILPLGTHKEHHPKVKYVDVKDIKLVRLDEFIKTNNISIDDYNFLNIDVQGVELNVIKSLGDLISNIDYIYTEINEEELYKGCCLVDQIDEYLIAYNFKRVRTHMTSHKWGDAFYVKIDLL